MSGEPEISSADGGFGPGLGDAELLEAVVVHYRAALADAPPLHAWLIDHGVRHGEVVERFGLGWSDRTLGLSLPTAARVAGRELRGRLEALGVLRSTGHEQFRGCLVVPVRDDTGRVVQLYGHRLQRPQRQRDGELPAEVLWLPEPTAGVWHAEAMAASAEVIVAASVLDGLVWWSAGYRNVMAPGGPDGFGDDLGDRLVDAGVTRVLLAQPRSAPSDQDATDLAARLATVDVECFRVVFPHGCDASTVAVEADDASIALGERLRAATWLGAGPAPARDRVVTSDGPTPPTPTRTIGGPRPLPPTHGPHGEAAVTASPIPPPPPAGRDVEVEGGELRVTIGALTWRVRGLDRVTGPGSLRVNVSARRDDAFHLDVVDLFSARARQLFVKAVAMELGADEERVRRDLGRVLLACEDRVLDLQAEAATPTSTTPAMTAAEEQAALELLRDPKLLERVVDDVAALGVVGERDNALVAYLAATSRLLDTPLAVVVQSGSAAGKSTLTDAVLSLMPADQRLSVSAMTGQSLFYLGEHELAHKVLSVAEAEAELELPRVPRWQPRSAMSVAEVEDVLARPNLDTPDGLRDRAILEVFYSTAIRASELAALQVFDLDVARGTLAVNAGKGGRSRVVPIAERAVAWCEKWMLDGRPALLVPPDDGRLFVNNRGGPLSAKTLTAIARRHLDAAGIIKPGACHLFRHTAATLKLEGGADIRFIQQLLGHAELTTTQLYTHVAITSLKAVHERCHPGAGNRPPRTPWPPQNSDVDDGIDGWDQRASALLDALDGDEPDA